MKTVERKIATVTKSPRVPAAAAVALSDEAIPQSTISSPAVTSIAVIGLGYVGLPLSIQFARSGVAVLGLDIDLEKVLAVNRAQSYIKHISSQSIGALVASSHLSASADFSRVR